jgi:SAM-dependent methyltransferase
MLKIYLGAGKDKREGFTYLDAFPFPGVTLWKCPDPLPFPDSSVDECFSQDFLEHIKSEDKIPLMNDIWRVLKPEGTMEHIIPMAGSRNDFGSPSHISHWHPQQFEHFDIDSYRYTIDHEYEGFVGGFRKVSLITSDDGQTFHVIYKAIK